MRKRATKTIKTPHDKSVAFSEGVESQVETRPSRDSPGRHIGKNLGATGALQSIDLHRELLLPRTDAGISDDDHAPMMHGHGSSRRTWRVF